MGELGLQALPAGRSRPGTGLAAPPRPPASLAAATAAPSGATLPPRLQQQLGRATQLDDGDDALRQRTRIMMGKKLANP